MRERCFSFSGFVLLSLVIHGLGAAWFYILPEDETIIAKKSETVRISVGLQAAMVGARVTTQASIAPAERDAALDIPEPLPEPEKQMVPKKAPEEKIDTKKSHQEIVKPRDKKEQRKEFKAEPKPQETKSPVAPELVAQNNAGDQGIDGTMQEASSKNETGAGDQAGGIADETQFDFYIRQHLLSRKVTPAILKSHRQQGVVIVVFTLDRFGKLKDYKIAKPSRIREFDRAAIKLVRNAEPFPVAPDFVTWQQREYSIEISYSVK